MSALADLQAEIAKLHAIIDDLTQQTGEPRDMTDGVDTIDDYMLAVERAGETG